MATLKEGICMIYMQDNDLVTRRCKQDIAATAVVNFSAQVNNEYISHLNISQMDAVNNLRKNFSRAFTPDFTTISSNMGIWN